MNQQKLTFSTLLVFWVFYLFYLCGILFPETWWATHFLYFLPAIKKWGFLVGSLLSPLVFYLGSKIIRNDFQISPQPQKQKNLMFLLIAMIAGFVMFQFPMVFDYYGEAYKLRGFMDIVPSAIPERTNEALFSFSLSPWAGQNTILAVVTYIAFWTQSTYQNAFYLVDSVTGSLFVFVWLLFVNHYLKKTGTKILVSIAGLVSPFMLTFFGHIEIYGPIFFVNILWLILALVFLKRNKPAYLYLLGFLLLIALKLHAVALLFLPAYILLLLRFYSAEFSEKIQLFTWPKLATYVLSPIILIGAFFYFFVFKDYNDPRQLQYTVGEYDRLFLPVLSPEPPLDKYNLLGWNHLFDYFSEMLLWSPGIIFLLVLSVLVFRKKIKWNTPEIIISGVSFLLFSLLFFVVNPLLSLQMDWDLFVMPAPLLLIFGVVIIQQVESEINRSFIAGSLFGILLLVFPNFMVHNSESQLANRTEMVGIRIFKTYYEWARQTLNLAWSHLPENELLVEQRKKDVLEKLKPFAIPEKDYEYANLILDSAKKEIKEKGNPQKGLEIIKEAEYYFSDINSIILSKLEAHFLLKNFTNAFMLSEQLIEKKYPNEENAYRISIHCALEAKMYQKALEKSENYIGKFGSNNLINEVNQRLKNNDNIENLKFLFSRK